MQRSIVPAPHFLARNLKDECQRILTLTGAPNPDIRAIAQHTVLMPSLAKAVVNHVNSIGHRRKHPIRDAEHAVVFLGAERLHQLARKMRDQSDATPASDAVEPAPSAQPSSFGASFNAPVR
jgi:HD-like signal output (HDOD) protein